MSAPDRSPESAWLLEGLGAAALVLVAIAVGAVAAVVWIAVKVPV